MKNNHDMLEQMLTDTDFSRESADKEEMRVNLMRKLDEYQNKPEAPSQTRGRKARFKPAYALAAALTVTLAFSMMAYGGNVLRVLKEFSVGNHATYFVSEVDEGVVFPLPEELQGLLFDADGNAVTSFPKDGTAFLASGEPAAILNSGESIEIADGMGVRTKVIAVPESQAAEMSERIELEREATRMTFFDTVDDARPYLAFDFMMPSALPKGFSVSRVYLFNNENGTLPPKEECKYLSYELVNADGSQDVYVQLRLMDEETAFESSASDKMREVTINGNPGVVDGRNLDVEIDGVMYMFMAGNTDITEGELIAMAESLE